MRKTSVTVVLILATITATAQTKKKLAAPVIPDEKTAVAVAEAVLIPIYGEERVRKERPFKGLRKPIEQKF
jgi:hypothetical protein